LLPTSLLRVPCSHTTPWLHPPTSTLHSPLHSSPTRRSSDLIDCPSVRCPYPIVNLRAVREVYRQKHPPWSDPRQPHYRSDRPPGSPADDRRRGPDHRECAGHQPCRLPAVPARWPARGLPPDCRPRPPWSECK